MDSVPKEIKEAILVIKSRALNGGGFSAKTGRDFRPDSTAWGILALKASGDDFSKVIQSGRKRLADCQQKDGRISLSKNLPDTFWPTGLSILSWTGDQGFDDAIAKASQFLVTTTGLHFHRKTEYRDHDSSIKGWPWVEGTYSWIIPSSIAILALKANSYSSHDRVSEGIRMIYNRQIPSGGWNFGDNFSFGTELLPFPEATGHALNALSGSIGKESVKSSIDYLKKVATKVRTPLSLSWAILGLSAWSELPNNSREWLLESLSLQNRYGPYDTDLLSQIVIAFFASKGLLSIF